MTTYYKYTNSKNTYDIKDFIVQGTNDPTNGTYTNFPRGNGSLFNINKLSNGTKLGYSVNGTDIASSYTCKSINITASTNIDIVKDYPWCTSVAFVAVGGGGGGGTGGWGSNSNNGSGGGGGGGGGIILTKPISLGTSTTIAVIIGAGGAGGELGLTSNLNLITNGTDGGNTEVTINDDKYIAGGGKGGQKGWNVSNNPFPSNYGEGGSGGTNTVPKQEYQYSNQQGGNGNTVLQGRDGGAIVNGLYVGTGGKGGGISFTPSANYYGRITYTGGTEGLYPSNGIAGGSGSSGSGGGGGSGSQATGGDAGGPGGAGGAGYVIMYFYP